MANLTKSQLEQLNAVVLGTHDNLDTSPRMQPSTSVQDVYRGILPAAGPIMSAAKSTYDLNAPVYEVGYRSVDGSAGVGAGGSGSGRASLAPLRVAAAPHTVDAANPLDISRLGLTSDPFRPAAVKAIDNITVHGGSPTVPLILGGSAFRGGWGSGGLMNWQPVASSPAPAGDPWARDRFGIPPGPATVGLIMGSPGVKAASTAPMVKAITKVARPAQFAPGSPNASFEKDHGTGSATESMATSSRWNTGY